MGSDEKVTIHAHAQDKWPTRWTKKKLKFFMKFISLDHTWYFSHMVFFLPTYLYLSGLLLLLLGEGDRDKCLLFLNGDLLEKMTHNILVLQDQWHQGFIINATESKSNINVNCKHQCIHSVVWWMYILEWRRLKCC